VRRFLSRILAAIRRASAMVYRVLLIAMLAVVYALAFPWFALVVRMRRRPPRGFRVRRDPDVASLERLRSLY
jgi:hypothetical protein